MNLHYATFWTKAKDGVLKEIKSPINNYDISFMKKTAKKILRIAKTQAPKDTFADFFLRTPIAKQTEVLREVARKANADQRDLMKRYEKVVGNAV